ncbi:MAG: hypothetical protein JXR96_28630 [Deltaproteobacteria bacterium]|nr:hypothetical protein [Deltaproteobacteria bacterium]
MIVSKTSFLLAAFGLLVWLLPPPCSAQDDPGTGGGETEPKPAPPEGGEEGAPPPKKDAGEKLSEEELKELEGAVEEEVLVGPEVFDEGVKLYYEGNFVGACKRLWDYISGNQPGADKYGYAEFFLAQSLERIGLMHAAVEYYYNVAKNRTKPELLPDALSALERISRHHPFDQNLILHDLLYDSTFGYLRRDLRDFIEYNQGLLDYRNGFIRWGQKHFQSVREGSYYGYKAKYVEAVYDLVKYNLDDALKGFRAILDSDIKQADVINNARQSVARILFEQKKYKEAYEVYETIDAPIEKQASVFLEEAWTQYYLKDYQRAMGLLYALEAPAYFRYFNPEKYVLKALIYKNLCHYNVAKDAVSEFYQYYGDAIRVVYDRVDLDRNEILLDAALQEPRMVEIGRFQRLLDTELGMLDGFAFSWSENGLLEHLNRVYDLKIKEVNQQLRQKLDKALREVAEKLLLFEEQMNLLEYEIGLSIYRRIKGAPADKEEERDEIPYYSENTFFEFDGEFWNDELHDFRFYIEDRCFSEERWE